MIKPFTTFDKQKIINNYQFLLSYSFFFYYFKNINNTKNHAEKICL